MCECNNARVSQVCRIEVMLNVDTGGNHIFIRLKLDH